MTGIETEDASKIVKENPLELLIVSLGETEMIGKFQRKESSPEESVVRVAGTVLLAPGKILLDLKKRDLLSILKRNPPLRQLPRIISELTANILLFLTLGWRFMAILHIGLWVLPLILWTGVLHSE